MERQFTFIIPTLMGVESLVSHELKKLGLADVRAENGRVLCSGSLADIARINLNLRTGARVLLQLGQFPARSFEQLFDGTAALPWEEFIPLGGQFPVKGYTITSQLPADPPCQAIIKKAIAKRLGQVYGLETLPEDGPLYQVQFSILKDQAVLMLDTSGDGLH